MHSPFGVEAVDTDLKKMVESGPRLPLLDQCVEVKLSFCWALWSSCSTLQKQMVYLDTFSYCSTGKPGPLGQERSKGSR